MSDSYINPGDVDLVGRAMLGAVETLSRARAALTDDLDAFLVRVGNQPELVSIDLVARTDHVLNVLDDLARGCGADGRHMMATVARVRAADEPLAMPPGDELTTAQRWWNRSVDVAAPIVANDIYEVAADGRKLIDLATSPQRALDRFLFGRAERDPAGGDLGGAYQTRPTLGFDGSMARNPTDRGRQALSYFLAETDPGIQHHDGEEPQIRSDEFELIDHGGNAYTVVLPGVTDLKRPSVGMDPDTNTVRDLDGFSIRSWLDTSKEANYYALMVEQGLVSAGVPLGAELIIVGHSFGADTALDLAADRAFNGGTYDVTHVIAAGYHSQPQLEYVPDGTRVLVLQNRNDMAVKAESVLDRITFDSPTKHDHDAIVDVFDGGFSGAGHHQRHYVDHIEASDDASVGRFLASLDARGHTRPGSSLAVDVSVPMSSPKPDL